MRISTTKAHPTGEGRAIKMTYAITCTSAGASGGGRLPEDTDSVAIMAHAEDGEDKSTSTRVFITFGLDDSADHLDALIGKLTDLRAKQRALALEGERVFGAGEQRIGWESPPCQNFAGGGDEVRAELGLCSPFCACGRRLSDCDGSRLGCRK